MGSDYDTAEVRVRHVVCSDASPGRLAGSASSTMPVARIPTLPGARSPYAVLIIDSQFLLA